MLLLLLLLLLLEGMHAVLLCFNLPHAAGSCCCCCCCSNSSTCSAASSPSLFKPKVLLHLLLQAVLHAHVCVRVREAVATPCCAALWQLAAFLQPYTAAPAQASGHQQQQQQHDKHVRSSDGCIMWVVAVAHIRHELC
jgi:hypothetical protein